MNISNHSCGKIQTTLILNCFNIILGLAAVLLNAFAFILFIKTKNLRCNLFYRLLFPIYLLHSIASIFITVDHLFILQGIDSYYYQYVSVVCLMHSMICMQFSVIQTAIISIDRYQASLPRVKSVTLKRRQILGTVSVVMFVSIVGMNYTTVLRQTPLINDEVVTCDEIVTSGIRIVTGVIYFFSIFIIEIPMCMLTFFNIRKNMRTVGNEIRIRPNKAEVQVKHFQTPTVQKMSRMKMNALKVLIGVVLIHCITFMPLPIILVASFETNRNTHMDNSYSGIFRLIVLVHYIMDALFAFVTVSPLKEKLKHMCCGWKLRGKSP